MSDSLRPAARTSTDATDRSGLPPGIALVGRLYDAAGTRALDASMINDHGVPGIVLMRRAGAAAFEFLRGHWPEARTLTVLCGRGNNAGDGYVIAGIALARGFAVQLLQVTDAAALEGDAARARDWAVGEGVRIDTFTAAAELTGDVVVDALLGTGLRGAVRAEFVEAIDAIAAAGRPVLAVDLPSGLSADTGAVLGSAVRADATVTFIGLKRGLLTGAGPALAGTLCFEDLGVPEAVYAAPDAPPSLPLLRLGRDGLDLPRRARDAHKGAFGHVLIVGGDLGTGGAVIMAAEAALRSGAGLVSAGTRVEHLAPLLARLPEVMVCPVAARGDLAPLLARASVAVVGPGLGTHPWAEQILDAVLEAGGPMVVDADGLNLLAARGGRSDDWVLTPHPGEAARLLGTDTASIAADRFAAVRALQVRYGGVVVLKGAGTLVADGDGVALCPYGNPGMASGGMGDVLAGLIGGLMAQGLAAPAAARLGVCLHGAAADTAAEELGERALVATDLMGPLAQWLVRIES